MNDVSVYLGRQRGRGVPDRKNAFCTRIPRFEQRTVRFSLIRAFKTPALGAETTGKGLKLDQGPLSPLSI